MEAPPVGQPRWVQVVAWVLAVLSLTVLAAAAVLRSTALNPGFHGRVLDEERAYHRVYDEVLVDPRLAPVLHDLLGRLPVPQSTVTSNVKVVLPPETLRAIGDRQITEVVRYLEGDRARLRLAVDLRPVLANIDRLSQIYFGTAVASLQQRSEPDFDVFRQNLADLAVRLVAGEVPRGELPTLALSQEQARAATTMLLRLVPQAERAQLRPEVEAALEDGDAASALAAVAPVAVSDGVGAAVAELLREAGGRTWVIRADLGPSDTVSAVDRIRSVTRLFHEVVEPAAAVLSVAALVLLWHATPLPATRRLVPLGWALAGAATLTALAVFLLRVLVGERPYRPPSSWPPAAARLLDDLQANAVDRVLHTATVVALILLVAGALLVGLGWARRTTAPTLQTRVEARHGLVLAAAVSASALVGATLAPVALTGPAPRVCQGSSRLCDVRYDELAQLAAHNAMATTTDRFIGPLQDPDIVGQLNAGVRVLLLDTHRWERPAEITDRLADSEFSPELRRQLTDALTRLDPHRPGLWLCHSVCGAGALELEATLRQIGDWLRAHPSEIVTLILQDGVGAPETQRAFERAGLTELLYEPDQDADQAWPRLEEMIDSGRRLVVFAEKADGPAPWYRNFYRYGMETPFAVRSPEEMTCAPNRGGTDKRLFLLNHFVTAGGGRRLEAGTVNARDFVLDRAHACEQQRGRPVNFIAVDYATIGDARAAVDALNTERLRDDGDAAVTP
ncbi:PI-PLC domain-containing protein [Streptomyces sp. B93]|uniref:PI-PLC domain-containing protein n=1 Tax=Streptomyces sp. B93 TaxID=2824875 RepID=UPI001B35C138|nr:PI-PLC domain-containing protein [Streptomyces sp. B93]MBQ1093634.1 hypothetical protein [Streptomyces sp. B93]